MLCFLGYVRIEFYTLVNSFAFQEGVTTFAPLKKNRFAMPKMKTRSGAKKRFRLTGTGKVKRMHAFTSHLMRHKSKKTKLRLVNSTIVHAADEKRVKRMLGVG